MDRSQACSDQAIASDLIWAALRTAARKCDATSSTGPAGLAALLHPGSGTLLGSLPRWT